MTATVGGEPDRSLWGRVGTVVHGALVVLATDRDGITPARILDVAGRAARNLPRTGSGVRVGVQHVAGLTAIGVRMFPPQAWGFHGGEVCVGDGRADLVWRSPEGVVLIDEVKAGTWRDHRVDRSTSSQIGRYLQSGTRLFGPDFVGVRLLTLAAPTRSLWFPTGTGERTVLGATPWWFGFAAPWETTS